MRSTHLRLHQIRRQILFHGCGARHEEGSGALFSEALTGLALGSPKNGVEAAVSIAGGRLEEEPLQTTKTSWQGSSVVEQPRKRSGLVGS